LFQENSQVDIVTGGAGQRIKIDAFAFETRVFVLLPAMAAVTGCRLLLPVAEEIGFDMDLVAGGAVDRAPVVHAAKERDLLRARGFMRMTAQAGVELIFPWCNIRTASEGGQRREPAAAMGPRHVDASGTMTGLTGLCGGGGLRIFGIPVGV
jgi:hypothetical protein